MKSLFALAAALALAAPQPGQAQDAAAPRGWIGISFRVVTEGDASGVHSFVLIDEVNEGSPAQRAGLRPGDELVRIEHVAGPDSLMNLNEYLHVAPGDDVRMVFLREGHLHELTVHAADGSSRPEPTRTFMLSFQPDSMVETMVRAMDSIRVRLIEQSGDVRVVTRYRDLAPADRRSTSTFRVVGAAPAARPDNDEWDLADAWVTDVRAPFSFGLFRSERHDSLQHVMEGLNRHMRELRAREAERLRELVRVEGSLQRVDQSDEVLQEVRGTLTDLFTESRRVRKAMDNAARESAGAAYTFSAPRVSSEGADVPEARSEFRPLAPYLLGENRAAGAEVRDLDPEFAEALGVAGGGVLVLDVPSGTPAAVAGVRAGDVITKIDQVTVRSVDDLRLGLSRAGPETPLTLVRQGKSRQVLLRR